MDHSICERCFHYAACSAIDVTGSVGNPDNHSENEICGHFVPAGMVKIQPKGFWTEHVRRYSDGDVGITYKCSHCNNLEKVKMFKKVEWDDYFSQHHHDGLELPKYCRNCGSIIEGIVPNV